MTILIGLLCKDGVVIGADCSTTFSALQTRTIEQETKKINIINNEVILVGTGGVGYGQRFAFLIEQYWNQRLFIDPASGVPKHHTIVGVELAQNAINNFRFTGMSNVRPTGAPSNALEYGALVAFPLADAFYLCEFEVGIFQPEFKTENIWYVSMGSGQPIADPFLGLLRNIFWQNNRPTLRDGIFYVTWALLHCIEVNPGGINSPHQIAILEKVNNQYVARLLTSQELEEHKNSVQGAKEHFREFQRIQENNLKAQDIP